MPDRNPERRSAEFVARTRHTFGISVISHIKATSWITLLSRRPKIGASTSGRTFASKTVSGLFGILRIRVSRATCTGQLFLACRRNLGQGGAFHLFPEGLEVVFIKEEPRKLEFDGPLLKLRFERRYLVRALRRRDERLPFIRPRPERDARYAFVPNVLHGDSLENYGRGIGS